MGTKLAPLYLVMATGFDQMLGVKRDGHRVDDVAGRQGGGRSRKGRAVALGEAVGRPQARGERRPGEWPVLRGALDAVIAEGVVAVHAVETLVDWKPAL